MTDKKTGHPKGRHSTTSQSSFAALCLSVCTGLTIAGQAAMSQGTADPALANLIKEQKLVTANQTVTATLEQNQVTIVCDRNKTDDDAACRRRAILIAKSAFDAEPSQIQKAKIQFVNAQNATTTIGVKRSEIAMFAEGKLDEKTLMESIDFSNEGVAAQSSVVDGEMQPQRTLLLTRINKMKERGTNVTAFMNIFNEIEGLAKSGDTKTMAKRIDYLSDKVSDQEKMVSQATGRSHAAYSGTGSGSSFSETMPKDLAQDLDTFPSEIVTQVTGLRAALVRANQSSGGDPRARSALASLDAAIHSRQVLQLGYALQDVIDALKLTGARPPKGK